MADDPMERTLKRVIRHARVASTFFQELTRNGMPTVEAASLTTNYMAMHVHLESMTNTGGAVGLTIGDH